MCSKAILAASNAKVKQSMEYWKQLPQQGSRISSVKSLHQSACSVFVGNPVDGRLFAH